MKQKIVIQVSMSCEKNRSKAMSLAARTTGVISTGIIGDGRDRLEVIGVGVDPVCLVCCLRKKLGHAKILQVEEVKDNKPDPKPQPQPQPQPPAPAPPYIPYPCYHHHPQMVVCEEPSGNCAIM